MMKLLDWVDIDWYRLSCNPNAIDLLRDDHRIK